MRSLLILSLLLPALALPSLTQAAPSSSELAEAARALSLDAETWPAGSTEARSAWELAADAYRRWLNQFDGTEQAGRLRYAYAAALEGAGQRQMAFEQYEVVLAAPENVTPDMVFHGALSADALGGWLTREKPEQANAIRKRRLDLLAVGLAVVGEDARGARLHLASAAVLEQLADPIAAAEHLRAAMVDASLVEPATAELLTLLEEQRDWTGINAAARRCLEDSRLQGTVTGRRCREAAERSAWQSLKYSDAPAAQRGESLLQFVRQNPQSDHRREALRTAAELLEEAADPAAWDAKALFVEHFPLDPSSKELGAALATAFEGQERWADAVSWYAWVGEQDGESSDAEAGLVRVAGNLEGAAAIKAWQAYLRTWPDGKKAGRARRELKKLGAP